MRQDFKYSGQKNIVHDDRLYSCVSIVSVLVKCTWLIMTDCTDVPAFVTPLVQMFTAHNDKELGYLRTLSSLLSSFQWYCWGASGSAQIPLSKVRPRCKRRHCLATA